MVVSLSVRALCSTPSASPFRCCSVPQISFSYFFSTAPLRLAVACGFGSSCPCGDEVAHTPRAFFWHLSSAYGSSPLGVIYLVPGDRSFPLCLSPSSSDPYFREKKPSLIGFLWIRSGIVFSRSSTSVQEYQQERSVLPSPTFWWEREPSVSCA